MPPAGAYLLRASQMGFWQAQERSLWRFIMKDLATEFAEKIFIFPSASSAPLRQEKFSLLDF
jgi:hypothetical protein